MCNIILLKKTTIAWKRTAYLLIPICPIFHKTLPNDQLKQQAYWACAMQFLELDPKDIVSIAGFVWLMPILSL